jgi:glycosyltransferase involved in cell wall biosynthesis
MKQLRVAMLAPPWLSIPPIGYGGIENVINPLIPALEKLGVQVELISVGNSTIKVTKNHWLYQEGQYAHIHRPLYESLPIIIAHTLFAIKVIKDDGKFDVIHDHTGFLGNLAFSLNSPGLPPTVQTLHGPPFSSKENLDRGDVDNLQMWRQLKDATDMYIVPISKAVVKNAPPEIRRLMLKPVYNAVDTDEYSFVPKKDKYFITLARFHPEKGQHIAVKLAMELGYNLKMAGLVAGIGSPRQLLLEIANPLSPYRSVVDFRYYSDQIFPYIDGKIEYVGEVKGRVKMKFMGHARALLFPIQWEEPFGLAAIEALACGTPVVAMARGALPEIIQHGVNGFLANNEREFKKYMQMVDQIDPAACRDSIEKNFSADKMAKEYLSRYQTAIERHRPASRSKKSS